MNPMPADCLVNGTETTITVFFEIRYYRCFRYWRVPLYWLDVNLVCQSRRLQALEFKSPLESPLEQDWKICFTEEHTPVTDHKALG